MDRLYLEEFMEDTASYDRAVSQTPEIDHFCSSSPWILAAYDAFSSNFETWIARHDAGYVALVESQHERLGRFRQPMEASWCLASPFAGADQSGLAHAFLDVSIQEAPQWDLLFLSGITRDSELFHTLAHGFGGHYFVGVGPPVSRFIASLDGGVEGFLSRRSSKFRANLRRIRRRATEEGFSFEYLFAPDDWASLYDVILEIESRSWKGKAGTGIVDASMQRFYRGMLPRLAAMGALRVGFLCKAGERVGFIFGGVLNGTYRGLQLSFDEDWRSFSLGNLAQLLMIEHLAEEGVAAYDLGSELEYKSRWAEQRLETVSLVIRRW